MITTDEVRFQLRPDAPIDGELQKQIEKARGMMGSLSPDQRPTFVATRPPGLELSTLVKVLTEHGVTFSGEIADNFWRTLLLGWLLPFALIMLMWNLIARRMGPGGAAGALSFGRNKAKIYGENDIKVRFDDVAGIDEAKAELEAVVSFLSRPGDVPAARRPHPEGRAAGRPAGHRQDAARARDRRRGARAVLLDQRLGVHRDVRRARRGARPRPLRAGEGEGAVHRLHRRARRGRKVARRRRPADGPPRRAGADPEPAPGRDGRLRRLEGRRAARRDQPSRGARPGPAARRTLRPAHHRRAARSRRARRRSCRCT